MRNKILNLTKLSLDSHGHDAKVVKQVIYGIESLYINLSKLFIVLLIAYLMDNFTEVLCLLFFSRFLRKYSYGLHLSTSLNCLLFSIILINFLPRLTVNLNLVSRLIILALSFLSITLYSPATTKKGRQLSTEEYKLAKTYSSIIASLYCVLSAIKMPLLSFSCFNALIIQSIIVNPALFKLIYERRNYEKISK